MQTRRIRSILSLPAHQKPTDGILQCPAVGTVIPVSAVTREHRPDIELSVVSAGSHSEEPVSDLNSDSDSESDSDSGCTSGPASWGRGLGDTDSIEPGQSEGFEMFEEAPVKSAMDDEPEHNPQVSTSSSSSPGQKEYTFPWYSIEFRTPPSINAAQLALQDVKNLLHPPRDKGHRSKITGLTSTLQKRLT
jgi:hypothetical protein